MKMLIPFRSELPELIHRMDDLFHFPDIRFGSSMPTFRSTLQDKGRSYVVELDLPGSNRADVHVEVFNNNTLKVQGAQKFEQSDRGYYVAQYGRFERTLRLPGDADPSTLKTRFNGDRVCIEIGKSGVKEPWYRRWMNYLKAAW